MVVVGHFGEVYKGQVQEFPENPPRSVAVKRLKEPFDESDIILFMEEALHMRQLNHPHVVSQLR